MGFIKTTIGTLMIGAMLYGTIRYGGCDYIVRETEIQENIRQPVRKTGENYVKTIDCLIETLQKARESYLKNDEKPLLNHESFQRR